MSDGSSCSISITASPSSAPHRSSGHPHPPSIERSAGPSKCWPCTTSITQEIHRRDNSYIRVSGVGDCRRKVGYRVLYHRQEKRELPIWTHGLTIFELGHGLHLKLQERMSNVGPLKWIDAEPAIDGDGRFGWAGNCEIPLIDHEYRVAGRCDGLSRPLRRYTRTIDGQPMEF